VVTAVTEVSAETLLNHTVKMVRRGSIVYTDKFRSYGALMFCGYKHMRIDHRKRFSNGNVYIKGLEGFWGCAKECLIKHHGYPKQKFPLYRTEWNSGIITVTEITLPYWFNISVILFQIFHNHPDLL
jgi:transposase